MERENEDRHCIDCWGGHEEYCAHSRNTGQITEPFCNKAESGKRNQEACQRRSTSSGCIESAGGGGPRYERGGKQIACVVIDGGFTTRQIRVAQLEERRIFMELTNRLGKEDGIAKRLDLHGISYGT